MPFTASTKGWGDAFHRAASPRIAAGPWRPYGLPQDMNLRCNNQPDVSAIFPPRNRYAQFSRLLDLPQRIRVLNEGSSLWKCLDQEATMVRSFIPETTNRAASGALRWFRDAADRLGRLAEWDSLSDNERRQLSADIAISDVELGRAVCEGRGSSELMALLSRPTLRRRSYPLDVLRDMQRVCTFCTQHKRCRKWQENAAIAARWPVFCPNASTFASLRRSGTTQPDFGSQP